MSSPPPPDQAPVNEAPIQTADADAVRPGRSRFDYVLVIACVTSWSCAAALTPGVPAGPIVAPGLRLGTSYAYAYAPGTVHAVEGNATDRSAPRVTVHHNTAMLWGNAISIFPAGLAFRVAPRQWFDVGVDLGIRESGLLALGEAVPGIAHHHRLQRMHAGGHAGREQLGAGDGAEWDVAARVT